MNWSNKCCQIVCLAIALFTSALPLKAEKLIEVDELFQLMESKKIKLIDVRPLHDYQLGHLPGAVQVWRTDFTDTSYAYGGMMASLSQMETVLSNLGIQPGEEIILYDDKASCNAARLWWILDYYGHRNIRLLNGGLKKWQLNELPLSTENSIIAPTEFKFIESIDNKHKANIEDVKDAINSQHIKLIDTRSDDEFLGLTKRKSAYRSGRIPSSIQLDWVNTVNFEGDHTFKTVESLKNLVHDFRLTSSEQIVVYCQSGSRSAHTTFVLTQLLGYENVRNYDGSWIEWSYNKDLPIESGSFLAQNKAEKKLEKSYIKIATEAYHNYAHYLWHEITHPGWHNYFYWLIVVSALFFVIELTFPWRAKQGPFRKDFWLDFFYMFFNFFLFSLIIFNAASEVVVNFFNHALASIGISNLIAFKVQSWPVWMHLLIGFVLRDFIQWWIHRLLHRVPFLWNFHKVHHSVEEMGFAAHLRFHWMENVVYRTLEYIPLALIGIGLRDFFVIHIFALTIGHWNHSNFKINIGWLKYIFNNPQMHIWHHAQDIPKNKPYGVNFGLTLSIWDYLFKTDYIPYDGKDIKLGFPGLEKFPHNFFNQSVYGFGRDKRLDDHDKT